jgi:hypothetical protein
MEFGTIAGLASPDYRECSKVLTVACPAVVRAFGMFGFGRDGTTAPSRAVPSQDTHPML